jgi:hypothetical protein
MASGGDLTYASHVAGVTGMPYHGQILVEMRSPQLFAQVDLEP